MLHYSTLHHVFSQLKAILQQIPAQTYSGPCSHLDGGTVGQHVRHVIEGFECLFNGYDTGTIDYEQRRRDLRTQEEAEYAVGRLQSVLDSMERADRNLRLTVSYQSDDEALSIATNYYRELAYNLEHTIHHMALIRIGIQEHTGLPLPADFGVAPSTVKYRRQCAQ